MTTLEFEHVDVAYERPHQAPVRAVCGVDLEVPPRTIVGLVGESGCGKTSLGRAAVGMVKPSAGRVLFEGREVVPLSHRVRPPWLRRLQMVFQDPGGSLNPRRKIGRQLDEAVHFATGEDAPRARTLDLLDRVGLSAAAASKYPHEFSGGQRQRLAIARALATSPSCVVADEPISSLDASAQAQIAQLLVSIVRERGMAMLFVSHDLGVVRQISDVTAVMYLGKIVEVGPTAEVWANPQHPYTASLIEAIPRLERLGAIPAELAGDVPDPSSPPPGCRFHPRCPHAFDRCTEQEPSLRRVGRQHAAACFLLEGVESPNPIRTEG